MGAITPPKNAPSTLCIVPLYVPLHLAHQSSNKLRFGDPPQVSVWDTVHKHPPQPEGQALPHSLAHQDGKAPRMGLLLLAAVCVRRREGKKGWGGGGGHDELQTGKSNNSTQQSSGLFPVASPRDRRRAALNSVPDSTGNHFKRSPAYSSDILPKMNSSSNTVWETGTET